MNVAVRPETIGIHHDPQHAPAADPTDPIALLADGRFEDAVTPLRLALANGDTRPSVILNLAIAEDRIGNTGHARRLMRHVAASLPDWDEPVVRLAESLRAAGETEAAEDAYRQALALNPGRTESLIALSGLLLMRDQAEEARDLLLHCCGIGPDNAEAWNTLGLALRMGDEPGLALSAFVRAQGLEPDRLEYVINGVNVAEEAKETEAEIARLTVACLQNPLKPTFHIGRGMLLERSRRPAEAIDAFETASVLAPEQLAPLRLLSAALTRAKRNTEAAVALRRILEIVPDDPVAANNLAVVLTRVQRIAEAREILLGVLDRDGPRSEALCNLVNATACLGLQDEAVRIAHSAIEAEPTSVLARRTMCSNFPYSDSVTGASMLAVMQNCSEVLPRTAWPPLANRPDPNRPLVVGLLSGSLQIHPVGWLTVAGIEALDRDQFSIVCLAQFTARDQIARRFRASSTEWVEIDGLSDTTVTEIARQREIDILIDLGGYGDTGRMTACAHRLAPVQIKWVGSQSHSSGLAEMDWFLTDRWETPAGFEPFYSERLLRLADGYVCYSPPPNAADVVALPALANGFVTFGCFNNLAKITPRVIETWAEILRRVPRARLVLKTHQFSDAPTADGLRAKFTSLGIDGERIELRGSSPHRTFMAQYGDIDIVLDPFPYSGGLTTCEALWMGVPTITLPGEIFASRHSASHLSNAGLADWLTGSIADYIEMAVNRTADLPALAALRASLREQVRQSPLCDAPRFGRSLGAALRHAWQAWCADQTTNPSTIAPAADT